MIFSFQNPWLYFKKKTVNLEVALANSHCRKAMREPPAHEMQGCFYVWTIIGIPPWPPGYKRLLN